MAPHPHTPAHAAHTHTRKTPRRTISARAPRPQGFSGGFTDGTSGTRHAFLIPYQHSGQGSGTPFGKVAKVKICCDAAAFDPSGVDVLNLTARHATRPRAAPLLARCSRRACFSVACSFFSLLLPLQDVNSTLKGFSGGFTDGT